MRNTPNGQTSTEQIAALVEELLTAANPTDFIEAVNYGFLTSIKDEMKTFKLSAKEVAGKVFLNQNLITFFYKLEAVRERNRLQKQLDNINQQEL